MLGISLVLISCILFIHLGMGDTIAKLIRKEFVLLKCTKCLTFWSTLTYSLTFTDFNIVECIATSFICAYVALWLDLLLSKLADIYEKLI